MDRSGVRRRRWFRNSIISAFSLLLTAIAVRNAS